MRSVFGGGSGAGVSGGAAGPRVPPPARHLLSMRGTQALVALPIMLATFALGLQVRTSDSLCMSRAPTPGTPLALSHCAGGPHLVQIQLVAANSVCPLHYSLMQHAPWLRSTSQPQQRPCKVLHHCIQTPQYPFFNTVHVMVRLYVLT